MSTTGTALTPGTVVAETYEVQRLLGRGGMGEVWAASHRRLPGKSVAIKVLHTELGPLPPEALARFRREAEIAARLSHPNIVEVLDFNTLPTGQPYLVMELLRGESLADVLSRGALEPMRLVSMVRQIASALKAAHDLGVVHRDLKPENIFVTPTEMGDQVKVLDFGISKLADSKTVQTTDSVLIGTPLYMSPEQALGNNRDVSPQSDVFSLASICYEALTGTKAFAAESVARVVFRIAYEQPTPLTQLRPGLPAPIVNAIEHGLKKERPARTNDIAQFVFELTGEALQTRAEPAAKPNVASGMYREDLGMSASLAEGATRAPSAAALSPIADTAPRQAVATEPAALAGPAPAPAPAPVTTPPKSKLPLIVLGAGGVVALVVGVIVFRPNPPPLPVPPVVPAVVAAVVDAGAAMAVVEAPDAGEPAVVVDAGEPAVALVDAGSASEPVKVTQKEPPMTAAEKALLAPLEAANKAKNWDETVQLHTILQGKLTTNAAKRHELALAIEAACALHKGLAVPLLNQLESQFGAAARRQAVAPCKVSWPERDW